MDNHLVLGSTQNLFFLENGVMTFLPDGQKILEKLKDLMRITLIKKGMFVPVSTHKTDTPIQKCEKYNNIFCRLVPTENKLPLKLFEFTQMKNTGQDATNKDLTTLDENTTLIGSTYCHPTSEALDIEFGNLISILTLFSKATGINFTFEFQHSTKTDAATEVVKKHIGETSHFVDDINDTHDIVSVVIYAYNELLNQFHGIGHIRILTEDVGLFYQKSDGTDFVSPYVIQFILINSFEKLFVPLLEQNKKLPFILNNNQICIIPIETEPDEKTYGYIQKLQKFFNMFSSRVDVRKGPFVAKVSDADRSGYEIVLIVGKKEVESNTLSYYFNNKSYIKKSPQDVMETLVSDFFNFLE